MTEPFDPWVHPPRSAARQAVARALEEDLLPSGDITATLVPYSARAAAVLVARAAGVLAGRLCAEETFTQVEPAIEVDWVLDDGAALQPGTVVARVEGPLRPILSAERTALNFLGHLSGVATLCRRYVDAVAAANPASRIWDTRKTTPGLRALERAAVRAGGGVNHRGSLSEGVLVKDNHLAGVSIAEAVATARARWPGRLLEVECDTIGQVEEALAAGAPMVLLDNMEPPQVEKCVSLAREGHRSPALVEVSGRLTPSGAAACAAAGADLISVGALTHSAPVLDLAIDLAGEEER